MLLKLSALLWGAALVCSAQTSPQKILPYPYVQEDLANGLRLVTVPTDFPNIVAVYIVVATGRAMRSNPATPVSLISSNT
jgi:zinc protease